MADAAASARSWAVPRLPVDAVLGGTALLAAGAAALACTRISIPVASDYGLVAALPPAFWVGVAVLNVLMLVALQRRRLSWPLMMTLQASLCIVVYATPSLASNIPRTEVAYRHLGIARSLTEAGAVDSSIDAYFSWPGFFAGLGAVLRTTGLDPSMAALWAPLVFGCLWLVGVAAVVRALSDDPRHLWLAMWLFTLTNWIDQDYLSPQAMAFFLYLAVLAIMLTVLASRPGTSLRAAVRGGAAVRGVATWWRSRTPTSPSSAGRLGGLVVAVLLSLTLVFTHQLTPVALAAALAALAVTGRTWAPGLLLILAVGLVLWLTTGASSYLVGHPVLDLSNAGASATENVAGRLEAGSPGHTMVKQVRTWLALGCWLLAAAGALRLRRSGRLDGRVILLFVAPFLMVPANPYGGEMILRATLFASPFTAFLVAGLLLPRRTTYTVRGLVLVGITLLVGSVALFTSRYGNARFDMFSESEARASTALYQAAPPGAVLIAGAHPTPWRYRNYSDFRHATLTELCDPEKTLVRCLPVLRERADRDGAGAMLLISRANIASMEMQGEHTADEVARLEEVLTNRAGARVVFRNDDSRIYLVPPREKAR